VLLHLPCLVWRFIAITQNFTRFSAWFGNNSHQGKQKRLLAELSCNMAAAESGATCSRASVRLDYLPAFRTVSTNRLRSLLVMQNDVVTSALSGYLWLLLHTLLPLGTGVSRAWQYNSL
jgi:hypothetical protein